ncbi:hypothetical protein BDV59DRAFT_189286 [Aspergillus ambiguus]|uniref:uncharacterized protein n=1 Tax=Aspergillus ambiguus TaxID=176160 RepID=UPI003CCC945F
MRFSYASLLALAAVPVLSVDIEAWESEDCSGETFYSTNEVTPNECHTFGIDTDGTSPVMRSVSVIGSFKFYDTPDCSGEPANVVNEVCGRLMDSNKPSLSFQYIA